MVKKRGKKRARETRKREELNVFLIVLGIIILAVALSLIFNDGSKESGNETANEICNSDNDCAPAECCHSARCTIKAKTADCSGIYCTQNCEPGTLDCGQAKCKCIKNECVVSIKNTNSAAEMANPASVYCEEKGGELEIRTDAIGGQYGVCLMNGKECEEWQFYRGQCSLQ